jgi:GT2 family glycosyltransferase
LARISEISLKISREIEAAVQVLKRMKVKEESRYKIVFLIVTWNRKEILGQCLLSLKKYIRYPHKIVVIDNASSDGTAKMLKSEFPEVLLIENEDNLGFSKANNQGMMYLREHNIPFEYLVFFNDDAKVEDDSLESLIDHMEKNPDVKAGIPSVFIDQGKLQTGVGGYELSILSAFNYFSFLSILFPALFKGFFIHQKYFRNKGLILELDWISGVCFVLRKDMMMSLKFDERFFMYAEDISLCREIRQYGKIVYYPLSQILHRKRNYSSGDDRALWLDSLFRYYRMQNEDKILLKLWLLKIIFFFGFFVRSMGYGVLALFSKKDNQEKRKELWFYCRHIMSGLFV